MEKSTCKKCGKELSDNSNDKLCGECQEKRKSFIRKLLIGVGAIGVAVAAVLIGSTNSDDEDDNDSDNAYNGCDDGLPENIGKAKEHPILPIKDYSWLYDHWGEDAANEVLDKVQTGEMTVEHIENCINRPDINPKDWQDFEEGWRPSGC